MMLQPVHAITGFESKVLERLQNIVASLPEGVAKLEIGKHPTHSSMVAPYFQVLPTNPRSAAIRGVVTNEEGFDLTIGQASSRELWITGGDIFKGKSCEEEFFLIC